MPTKMSIKKNYLGIDFGTSGCRAVVINQEKHILACTEICYPPDSINANGTHEQDPAIWWLNFIQLINNLSNKIKLSSICRLAIDATSGTVLLADKNGKAISPAIMYNDNRADLEATQIKALVPNNAAIHNSSSGIAKILWLKHHYQPDDSDLYLHQADWLLGQLTGNYTVTDYNNALKSGVDITSLQWPAWIEQLAIKAQQLPSVTIPGTTVGAIKPSLVTQLGFSPELVVITGSTDSTAAVRATGAVNVGDAVSSLGSSLVIKIVSDTAISNSKYGIYSQAYNGKYLVGGSSNSGAAVLKHYFTPTQMRHMSGSINPEKPTGLNYYPLLHNGERFPYNDNNYPACLSPRPDEDIIFFQAILEGIADIEYQCYQRLKEIGCPAVKQIFSVGGGSQNKVWTQIRQSRFSIPIITPKNCDAAYGSALLAQQSIS
ncbi:Carbohydrate kinase, FGGY family [hydrothermal vent metagenome]|uniref:Carbohydrate kinase, FGGY family n=1 Tax=hydrothermal vent metagenome TaxID=652676 RepID=A0A3B1AAL6_9ZZZZ